MLTGNQGTFLHSLPIVISSALICSRIVSMTFVPFLGNMILKASSKPERSIEERRRTGMSGVYYRLAGYAIDHRKVVLLIAFALLLGGLTLKSQLKNSFFPDDVQYISTIDVWLKNDANINATNRMAERVEQLVREEADKFATEENHGESVLESISTTVGGGSPRFWFTISPEQRQANYAQLIIRLKDKEFTPLLAPRLQEVLSSQIAGADLDVKQLQTTPVNYPVAIRLASRIQSSDGYDLEQIDNLNQYAEEVIKMLQQSKAARTVRSDWGDASMVARLNIDNDRANLAGITNQDIAVSTSAAINGVQVGTYREGHKQVPIVAQLQLDQRARMSDLRSLYVYAMAGDSKIPLLEVASTELDMATERIRRLEQFRTVTVFSFPKDGFLASDIMTDVQQQLDDLAEDLPSGYLMQISGVEANTTHGFGQLLTVMGISALAIFMALVFQFKNLVKPLLVFATVPFGIVGALAALVIMQEPFGFMAFLGIVSLIGVIVSHIILLFDFIEERHKAGDPFREALLDAGIIRLRPVLITVAATALALIPLAIEGGPLWKGLCYAQIGGLFVATFATLVLVPTLYAFVVMDLKAIDWEELPASGHAA
jgi:multidrug efflux pump subunit AcrB